ncbi:MAG: DUF2783 domain-containing protein [Bosea sp. (in: a-proteobacteria)]
MSESSPLLTESRSPAPDEAYRAIVEAQRGLNDAEAAAMNARLVLLLANHIGEMDVLRAALHLAKQNSKPDSEHLAASGEAR